MLPSSYHHHYHHPKPPRLSWMCAFHFWQKRKHSRITITFNLCADSQSVVYHPLQFTNVKIILTKPVHKQTDSWWWTYRKKHAHSLTSVLWRWVRYNGSAMVDIDIAMAQHMQCKLFIMSFHPGKLSLFKLRKRGWCHSSKNGRIYQVHFSMKNNTERSVLYLLSFFVECHYSEFVHCRNSQKILLQYIISYHKTWLSDFVARDIKYTVRVMLTFNH